MGSILQYNLLQKAKTNILCFLRFVFCIVYLYQNIVVSLTVHILRFFERSLYNFFTVSDVLAYNLVLPAHKVFLNYTSLPNR